MGEEWNEQTWEELLSSRIPSQYDQDKFGGSDEGASGSGYPDSDDEDADDSDESLWQRWVNRRPRPGSYDYIRLATNQMEGPSNYRSAALKKTNSMPRLAYPQSGVMGQGVPSDELASSIAVDKASRAAFGKPRSANTKSKPRNKLNKSAAAQRASAADPLRLAGPYYVDDPNPQLPFPTPPDLPHPSQMPSMTPRPGAPTQSNDALLILIPLLVLLSTLLLLLLLFLVMLIIVRRRARIALASGDGPLDVGREEELEGAGGLDGVEERWLEMQDEPTRRGYARAKDWVLSRPPGSDPSEITISQFLSIQEKGVSAWSFEPDYEANTSCYVEARTELTFVGEGEGMAPQEGGGCCVQSNLPLPKVNEVYYWEAKMFTKPDSTNISVGLATKPYPTFRMPGWSKYSVGFFSADGFKCHNYPFAAQSYGPSYVQGDVIGCGYRPRTGTVFYTRNGKKLEDAFVGLNRHNVFPTIGSDGPAEVHVNLGQAGFVYIEANVKKWGLAPMVGTLAPPPAYGQERGSILIETAGQGFSQQGGQPQQSHQPQQHLVPIGSGRRTPPPPLTPLGEEQSFQFDAAAPGQSSSSSSSSQQRRTSRRHQRRSRDREVATSPVHEQDDLEVPTSLSPGEHQRRRERRASSASSEGPLNPPTPGNADISLHALRGQYHSSSPSSASGSPSHGGRNANADALGSGYFPAVAPASPTPASAHQQQQGAWSPGRMASVPRSSSPPSYIVATSTAEGAAQAQNLTSSSSAAADPSSSSSAANADLAAPQPRRASGRTHRLANAVLGAFAGAEQQQRGSSPSTVSPGATPGGEVDYERQVGASPSERGRQGPSRVAVASSSGNVDAAQAARSARSTRSEPDTIAGMLPGWGRGLAEWWYGGGAEGATTQGQQGLGQGSAQSAQSAQQRNRRS